jgi:1,4-alpha-glucan branching enzyme
MSKSDKTTFPVYIPPFDLYLFGRGEHWDLYRLLGAHPAEQDGMRGYRFAVWAPNAREIHLTGEWNEWRYGEYPLYPVGVSGIWAAFVPGLGPGQLYKFGIKQQSGRIAYKTDPFAFYAETRPGIAPRTWTLDNYQWKDAEWIEARHSEGQLLDKPLSIYEAHAGSWRRRPDEVPGFLSYRELAEQLIPYVKELGFTHIQFMPLAEHPLDESWGYQVSHFFAPTSRFGAPEELKEFVDRCHQAGIGVFLDWVPGHFPKDDWCLGRFDGTALYEHEDPRQGEHPDWGTYIFNYGRREVHNFLLANALYWLKEFHIDGLRIDAVASMLYLDYSRKEGEWVPNKYGGKENLEAIEFLKELNRVAHGHFPGAALIAEESTAFPGVSRPLYVGGLGFTFKWNMGWMHDALEYMSKDPIYRPHHHNNLTFSMLYAFSENFVLPLSHDEVVHGKGSLAGKMPGDAWRQQANLRLLFAYQWAHPGKKLLFMGGEFGQWSEWNSSSQLDWMLLDFPSHQGILSLVRDLNRLLQEQPALHLRDHDWTGFQWVDFTDYENSVISFLRKAPNEKPVLWIFNFTPVAREKYCVGCPRPGYWREILNTDAEIYGGSNMGNGGCVQAQDAKLGLFAHFLELTLPPLAALAFTPE